MKKLTTLFLLTLFVMTASIVVFPKDSEAIPAFARRVGQACTLCHYQFPKLSEFGITFKNNGYRMPGVSSTENVWELKTVPLAAIIRVQAESTWGKDTTNSTTLKAEHFEVFFATPIKDHFSVFAEMAHEDGEDVKFSGNLSADNLTGTLGQLNIKAGNHIMREWDHFTQMRRILSTNYLAKDVVGVFKMFSMKGFGSESGSETTQSAAIEAYGQILAKGKRPTYRYKLGIHSDRDLVRDNKIAGGWGIFTTNFKGHNIGFMYTYADEAETSLSKDTTVHRVGANVELNIKNASIILGWNYQKRDDLATSTDDAKVNNFVAEVLYNVTPKLLLALREDFVKAEQGSADGDINRLTLGAYQYVMPNVKIGAEYSNEKRDELKPMMGKPMSIGSSATDANQTINTAKLIFELAF